MKKNWLDFGDLDPFSELQEGSICWKMAFLHPISWMNGWILTKLVQLYCWDRIRIWLDFGDLDPLEFGDLDPIIKVTEWGGEGGEGAKWLVCTLSPEWMEGFWLNVYIYIVLTWKRTD